MRQDTRIRFDYSPAFTSVTTRPARRLLAALILPLLAGVLAYVLTQNPPMDRHQESAAPAGEVSDLTPLPGEKLDFIVRRHDTLERIFRQLKLSLADLAAMLTLPGAQEALSQLRPGDKLTVVHEDGTVHALNRRISETEILSLTRADGGYAAEVITTPIELRATHATGTIDSSLFVAARAAGVNPETIMQLADDIFGWEIDFALDIRNGDRFYLVYEQKFRDGTYLGDARILAAEFVNAGEMHRAIYYASVDGVIDGYFTPDGRSMRRQFLRAPLDFRRVSSNFNPNRRHPILNTIRAHQGVDYSAPTGTSVKASGDGRVSFVGEKGGYGKVITLEHGGGISTLYAHLSGFARGVRTGQRVKQGQSIGYVGSSGAATGPHLHYEYRVNGIHRNPRTVRLPDAAPIPSAYLADFQSKSEELLSELARGQGTTVATQEGDGGHH